MTSPYKTAETGEVPGLRRCGCGELWADDVHIARCALRHKVTAGLVARAATYDVSEAKVRDLAAHLTHGDEFEQAANDALRVIELGWRSVIGSP